MNNKLFSCAPCSIEAAINTEKNIKTIDKIQLECFLRTIRKDCQNNAEFTEVTNSVIFAVLNTRMDLFLNVFSKSNTIDKDYILKQISSPLLDYNINDIVLKAKETKCDTITKKQVIKALKDIKK